MLADTAFVSTERFTPATFRRWLRERRGHDVNRYELLHGRIVMTPPAGWEHGSAEAVVARELGSHIAQRGLGESFGSSVGYELPSGDIVEPDFSYIDAARWKTGPPPAPGSFLHIAPTLAVEIISPSSAVRDRNEKKRIYETNGVREYWLVDHKAREVTVYTLRRTRYDKGRRFRGQERIRSVVLPDLILRAAQLFRAA